MVRNTLRGRQIESRNGFKGSSRKTFKDTLWQLRAGCILCVVIPWEKLQLECPPQSVKIDMFFATIDRILREFDRRFSDNIDVLRSSSVFNPSCDSGYCFDSVCDVPQHVKRTNILSSWSSEKIVPRKLM
jgi:hypothetical protein